MTSAPPIIIRAHEDDPQLVRLDVPVQCNAMLGRFGPARLSRSPRGAYVLGLAHLSEFTTWARREGLVLVDERATTDAVAGTWRTQRPPAECSRCGQAGSRRFPPRYCPTCGQGWAAAPPPAPERDDRSTTHCLTCARDVPRGFDYCARCGQPLALDDEPDADTGPAPVEDAEAGGPESVGAILARVAPPPSSPSP